MPRGMDSSQDTLGSPKGKWWLKVMWARLEKFGWVGVPNMGVWFPWGYGGWFGKVGVRGWLRWFSGFRFFFGWFFWFKIIDKKGDWIHAMSYKLWPWSVLKIGFCSSIIGLSALKMMVVFVQRLFLLIHWHRELCVGSLSFIILLSFTCK